MDLNYIPSDSDVICPKCLGSGLYDNSQKPTQPNFIVYECMYCDGIGSIDWITDIVGKKTPYNVNKVIMHINEFNYRIKEGRYEIKSR